MSTLETDGEIGDTEPPEPFRYGRGYVPDPPLMRTSFDHYAGLVGASGRALEIDLAKSVPIQHFDQTVLSLCTGASTAYAIAVAFASASMPLGFIPSPRAGYTNGRALDRTKHADGSFPALRDNGAMPNQIMRAYATFGVLPMGPLLGGVFCDADKSNVNAEPKLDEIIQEARTLVLGEYNISSYGPKRVQDLRTSLGAGVPVCIALCADLDLFQGYTTGVLEADAFQGPNDHYVVVVGYRVTQSGRVEFKIRNSWGDGWGAGGDVWVDESAVQTFGDMYAIVARRK